MVVPQLCSGERDHTRANSKTCGGSGWLAVRVRGMAQSAFGFGLRFGSVFVSVFGSAFSGLGCGVARYGTNTTNVLVVLVLALSMLP